MGRKNVLSIMIQSFVSMGVTTILWYAVGFSLCFSGGEGGIIGNLDMAFLRGIDPSTPFADGQIPMLVFVAYQMMFAIITPALITGAFSNRVRFPAYLIFLVGWLLLVYFPFVHMIWGGGLLAEWGVLDFAGGIAVHNIAGMAALASVLYVGKRRVAEEGPHSIPLVALGTGLLWFGWYGFNAGSELQVDQITVAGLRQHRHRRQLRGHHLADHRVEPRAQAALRRPADRRRGRSGHHHPGGGLRAHLGRGGDRHRRRRGLLPGRSS